MTPEYLRALAARNLQGAVETMRAACARAERGLSQGDSNACARVLHDLAGGFANATSSIETAMSHANDAHVVAALQARTPPPENPS